MRRWTSTSGNILLALLVAAAGTSPPGGATADGLEPLDPILRPGNILLLGELHGTVQSPAMVSRVVARARSLDLPVTVGLEIPREENGRIQTYLRSSGGETDRSAMLGGPFWQSSYQDGRRSEAMASLLDDLRRRIATGEDVLFVPFDRERYSDGAEREEWMAEALASSAAANPQRLLVVLVGNLHARLAAGSLPGLSETMAMRLAHRLPDRLLRSLELEAAGGTAWLCISGQAGCGVASVGGSETADGGAVTLHAVPDPRGYGGTIQLGVVEASPPAVAALRPEPAAPALEPSGSPALESLETPIFDLDAPDLAQPGPRRSVANVGTWPRWMGPRGDGASEPGVLPRGAAVTLELDWRRPLGPGHSSVSVLGERAVTLETDGKLVWVISLDVNDGRTVWRVPLSEGAGPADADMNTPLSTPLLDGDRVFAVHPAGRLFALAAADGGVLWWKDLATDFAAAPPSYGMSTSPILHGGRLYLMVGGTKGVNLAAFDPATGKVLLSVDQGRHASYATPVSAGPDDEPLVVPAGDRLYAASPATGEILWSYDGLPYPDRDPLLLSDGRLFVPLQERAVMLQVQRDAGRPAVRELWRSQQMQNSYSPAVHHQGALYGFGAGSMMCLDAATGAVRWEQPLAGGALIRVDDHLVALSSSNGIVRVVPASPDGYREAASLTVFPPGDYTATAPSFGAGRIFVRGDQAIAAVRLGAGS